MVEPTDPQVRTLQQQMLLLSRFAADLINLPEQETDTALNRVLKEMGELMGADRAYIFDYDFEANTTSNTHEWCAEGISPHIDEQQAIPLAQISDWLEVHWQGESLNINDVRSLEASTFKDILVAQNIRSLVSLPMIGREGCFGFVGFDAVRSQREYGSETLELLGLFAKILANHKERLRSEKQLSEREINFRTFFDNTQDFLFVLDMQGRIIYCNRHVTEKLGYSIKELYKQPVLSLHPQTRRDEAAQITRAVLEGKADQCRIPLQTRSGHQVPVETRVFTGQWNGEPALFGVSRDLTEVAASEEKFSKVFHLSPVAMAISEFQGQSCFFLEVNNAFCEVTGYSMEEVTGRSALELGLFLDQNEGDRIVEQLRHSEQLKSVEVGVRTKQGDTVHGLFNATLLQLQDRQALITQMLDISARKTAEVELASERLLLRTLFNTLPNPVWLKDPDGVYLACNSQFEALIGREESWIVGQTDFDIMDRDKAEFVRGNDKAAIREGRSRTDEEQLVFASDGYEGLFETTKTPMFDAGENLVGVLGVARDITESRRMERELQQTRKLEALGQLTGGIAHEFNNMLAIIMGYMELLQTRITPETDRHFAEYLGHIEEAGNQAKDLIRQMLTFSRPQHNRPEQLDLAESVLESINLARGSMPSSIEIDCQSVSGLPTVELDRGELQQVLTNLLINARDAMSGKGRITISVDLYKDEGCECRHCHSRITGDWLQVSVSDSGHGIDPQKLDYIFEPFYSSKTVGSGTGLGLSVVLGIVDRSGGHILVDTQPGEGACFRLLFSPATSESSNINDKPTIKPHEKMLRGRVLVVDDEPALTDYLQEVLRLQGLEVSVSNDSLQALQLLREKQFDLLITDQTMPGLLGTELARKGKEYRPELKTILCTGHSDQVNAANAEEQGMDHYLRKPVSVNRLWQVVASVLVD